MVQTKGMMPIESDSITQSPSAYQSQQLEKRRPRLLRELQSLQVLDNSLMFNRTILNVSKLLLHALIRHREIYALRDGEVSYPFPQIA